jgi:iron-sulfur cluster repair protein YtfE (RIC family)
MRMHSRGESLYDELRWVHGMVRDDLATVRELAVQVTNGMPAGELATEIGALQTNGLLWQLKAGCLHHCRFVHTHHRLEDAALFPALRRANPELAPVIERLKDEHRRVSDLLDEVEASAEALEDDRTRVVTALDALAEQLLAHLEFEEESVGPTMRRL